MSEAADCAAIRDLIERWVIWRDAGDWERFRTLWHDDGVMSATWTLSPVDEFIAASRKAMEAGMSAIHFLGGQAIDVTGDRAVAQTKMTISLRGPLEGVVCDIVCTGRFYDFLERRAERWGLVFRQPIYEKDRADAVDPGQRPVLDRELLARFPEGYRHLAYFQSRLGLTVATDLPGARGDALQRLLERGAAWLAGTNVFAHA
ncbi:MAG: nuclear transport factor 2 family protein [Candidatus Lustribacter sp.]